MREGSSSREEELKNFREEELKELKNFREEELKSIREEELKRVGEEELKSINREEERRSASREVETKEDGRNTPPQLRIAESPMKPTPTSMTVDPSSLTSRIREVEKLNQPRISVIPPKQQQQPIQPPPKRTKESSTRLFVLFLVSSCFSMVSLVTLSGVCHSSAMIVSMREGEAPVALLICTQYMNLISLLRPSLIQFSQYLVDFQLSLQEKKNATASPLTHETSFSTSQMNSPVLFWGILAILVLFVVWKSVARFSSFLTRVRDQAKKNVEEIQAREATLQVEEDEPAYPVSEYSHKTEETLSLGEEVVYFLEQDGWSVWPVERGNRALPTHFHSRVIEQCAMFVLVLDSSKPFRRQVLLEVSCALEHHKPIMLVRQDSRAEVVWGSDDHKSVILEEVESSAQQVDWGLQAGLHRQFDLMYSGLNTGNRVLPEGCLFHIAVASSASLHGSTDSIPASLPPAQSIYHSIAFLVGQVTDYESVASLMDFIHHQQQAGMVTNVEASVFVDILAARKLSMTHNNTMYLNATSESLARSLG